MSKKAVSILWDADEEVIDLLPSAIDIPEDEEIAEIGDYISDVTGYCHYGFSIERS